MALDFGMLQPVNIAGNILAGQQETQRNQLAQQQLAMGGLQQQKAQLELADYKNRQAGLDKFVQISMANGKTGSPDELAASFHDFALSQRDPHLILTAQQMLQAANERKAYMAERQPPSDAAMPSAANLPASNGTSDSSMRRQDVLEAGVKAQAPFVETRNLPARGEPLPPATPITNQLAPATAAPPAQVNQLAAPAGINIAGLQKRLLDLKTLYPNVPAAQNEAAMITKQLEDANKVHVIDNNLVNGAGQVIATIPKTTTPSELERMLVNSNLTLAQQIQAKQAWITKQTTHAPPVTVNVSTEKKYSEQFANKMADTDIAKMTTAEKAPELAANADRVLDIIKQGNVFTGSAADIKLNIARGLNVIGASNDEKIANTESLISGLAKNTLGAVKSSGLGSGAGFTDKDLQFLQDAEGGRITLNAQTLQRLATLSRKAAEKSAETWNSRVTQMPKSAIEGTGLSTQPISVPKRVEAPSAIYATNPKTGERIQSTDGGNTWKPAGAK
jgi:hypothetical protein